MKMVVAGFWPCQRRTLILIHILSVFSLSHRGKVGQPPVLPNTLPNPPSLWAAALPSSAAFCKTTWRKMRVGEVPGDRSVRPSVWGLRGLAGGWGGPFSGSGGGRAGPRCLPFEFSHCFTWVFSILPPTREVGTLKESVLKFFISSKLSGTGYSPVTYRMFKNLLTFGLELLTIKCSREAGV